MSMLSQQQFERVAGIARRRWGLHLPARKQPLVAGRLGAFLRGTQFPDVAAYLNHLEKEGTEEDMLVFFDVLSTNVTSFFRDRQHFDYLEREFFTPLARGNLALPARAIRMWSAGCATGPEAYSLAIAAVEHLRDLDSWDLRILGTDLSNQCVAAARAAVYEREQLAELGPELVERHFEGRPDPGGGALAVRARTKRLVSVARLNLMEAWPMRGPFDVIFCRNVMIYFDAAARAKLVGRFYQILRPGGLLTLGSAETLTGLGVPFRPVQASVYRK